jgi:hypothetical protein
LSATVDLAPPAGALIQSLRSIGYNFNSAIADIVDNSIDAKAKTIRVQIIPGNLDSFAVSILDDGAGMTFDELKDAMSLGSKSPELQRAEGDLGRFGMGLKTASFSQAKVLSVITLRSSGSWSGLRWNLDQVAQSNKWEAHVLPDEEIQQISDSVEGGGSLSSGTIVRWDYCDRLVSQAADTQLLSKTYTNTVKALEEHLSLVFHKFLAKKNLKLFINGRKLLPANPFCIPKGSESIGSNVFFEQGVSGAESGSDHNQKPIEVRGYLIPHPSRFKDADELKRVAPHGDFMSTQGIYVYRGQRLLSWGDWYRIVPKNQSNRLARIEIELPNALDHAWRLDIKKSKVELPTLFRAWLKPKVLHLTSQSQDTHTGRTTNPKLEKSPVWERRYDREKEGVHYVISGTHPLVSRISRSLKNESEREFKALLALVECSLPIDQISNDIGARVSIGFGEDEEQLPDQVKDLITSLVTAGIDADVLYNNLILDPTIGQLKPKLIKNFIDQLVA